MRTPLLRALVLLPALAGCRRASSPAAAPADTLIHLAVLQYEDRQFLSGEDLAVCAGVVAAGADAADPDPGLRDALTRGRPDILPASACARSAAGIVVASTRRPAALLTSGPIARRGADEVDVKGEVRRARSPSVSVVYRVVREPGRWRCLGPVVTGLPM